MFEFVVFLMMLFQVVIIGFAVFCLRLTKKTDIKDISVFLEKFMKVLLIILFICQGIGIFASLVEYVDSILLLIVIVKSVIEIYLYIVIAKYSLRFIKNLINDEIYVHSNVECLIEISRTFIYFAIINSIAGIVLAIFINLIESPNFNYSINVSTSFFMYLLLGVVFYVISLLYSRSIEIYEENQLTI